MMGWAGMGSRVAPHGRSGRVYVDVRVEYQTRSGLPGSSLVRMNFSQEKHACCLLSILRPFHTTIPSTQQALALLSRPPSRGAVQCTRWLCVTVWEQVDTACFSRGHFRCTRELHGISLQVRHSTSCLYAYTLPVLSPWVPTHEPIPAQPITPSGILILAPHRIDVPNGGTLLYVIL